MSVPSSASPSSGGSPGPYRLAVDLGTTYTAAAVADGSEPTMVGLGNRALQIPSVLFLTDDGGFLVGESAERRGAAEPDRVVREFKRRIGDHVPLLVAGVPYSAQALTARLLRWVLDVTDERMGRPPETVVLTHPANWGPYKLDLLLQAARLADLDEVQTCPEPNAAAAQYAANNRVEAGERLVVYDLGGGTFDVCVLEQTSDGFGLLGSPEGIEQLGGIDFDEAVFQQVMASLGTQVYELDPDDPAVTLGLARLRRECVEAKEALSTDVDAVVSVALPGITTSVRLNRSELESLIRPALRDTVAATQRALRSASITAADLSAIVLVGGSSRIPLVGEILQREFGVHTALDTHPKHDIAMGAARAPAAVAAVAPADSEPRPEPQSEPEPEPEPIPPVPPPEPISPQPTPEPIPEPSPEPEPIPPQPIPEPEPIPPEPGPEPEPIPPEPARPARSDPRPDAEPVPAADAATPGSAKGPRIRWPRLPARRILIGVLAAVIVVALIVTVSLLRPEVTPVIAETDPSSSRSATGRPTADPSPTPVGRKLPAARALAPTEMIIPMETDDGPQLFLADTGKSAPVRRLTREPFSTTGVFISPDRRSYFYLSGEDPEDREYWIAATSIGTDSGVRYAPRPSVCRGQYYRGAWNPADPTMIALPCTDADGDFGLHLMRTDGTMIRSIPIADGHRADDPAFSPDGQSLVYWASPVGDPGGALYLAPVSGEGEVRRLTAVGSLDADPVFSPDGGTIAFRRREHNNSDIYLMAADGSTDPVPLIKTPGDDQDPSWSPSGDQLIFKSDAESDYPGKTVPRIWLADADGSGRRLVWTEGAPGQQAAPAWSRR